MSNPSAQKPGFTWLMQMAWRDSRKNRSRLLLFIASIIIGVAALVAINSFGDNLQNDIEDQANELLGADLQISGNRPLSEPARNLVDSLKNVAEYSRENSFASMVVFSKTNETRLVQIRALEGDFPYYGTIETVPVPANQTFRSAQKALVDQGLMLQFNARVGDSVQIGELTFVIEGELHKVPGQAGIAATVAPAIYIPMQYLNETGLIQMGSRVIYRHYFKFEQGFDTEAFAERIKDRLDKENLSYETVEGRKEGVGRSFTNLTRFLNLIGFVALLLGCVGVASAVHVYMKDKVATVAVLRCLGLKGSQAFMIYLVQIFFMGLIGALIGALIGSFILQYLPLVMSDFLPVTVSTQFSLPAIGQGIATGVIVALLFAMLPLLSIRRVSPLQAIRASFQPDTLRKDPLRFLVYAGIIVFVMGFAWLQLRSWREAAIFTAAVLVAFVCLAAVGYAIMWLVRRFFPTGWSYLWRQSLSNLYRPQNQTVILLLSIGLGTALLSTLYFVQSLLLTQVTISATGSQPNMVLFDIQPHQRKPIIDLAGNYNMPVLDMVPVVTMRLEAINGRSSTEILQDTVTNAHPRFAFSREYRVTYRDSLIGSERIAEGTWQGNAPTDPNTPVPISLEDRYAQNMRVKIGDELTFNVQGAMVNTVVSSLRKIQWTRIQSNFVVLFPEGVLESAPQFHVMMTHVPSRESGARFQQATVQNFPNISVIDLELVLTTVDEILSRVAFVIRFMASFSIITGLLVLISSVFLSKYQRIQESILLRTLGASRAQILTITALEYFILGSLASLSGIMLSLLGSWALARFTFEIAFQPNMLPILLIWLIVTGLTMAIGLLNSRPLLSRPPLEVLREEV
jgi:putative ABC transport system permease protein